MSLHKSAAFILLAAGSGSRFGGRLSKQYRLFKGKPLLYWSLRHIAQARFYIHQVIIALPQGDAMSRLQERRCVPRNFPWDPLVVVGGKTRFASLTQAFMKVAGVGYVFVHDAARPNWPAQWIGRMLRCLEPQKKVSGLIPAIPVRETIKHFNEVLSTVSNRDRLYFSQTPQLVRRKDFVEALQKTEGGQVYLDEAQVLEKAGLKVLPYPGHVGNIKVTYPQDLEFLAKIIQ